MKFGSVCSGIEASSVAWHPLGWSAEWLSEIDPFPSAVLAHHYPDVPNLGDMTKIVDKLKAGEINAPDVFVGGTPCQAFSVAGLRGGLADPRGGLTLEFVRIANAIDDIRLSAGERPAIIVWENVPGVLSSKDNAFGCFLGALAGEDCELVPPGGKWTDAGCVYGPARSIAWRVLDAQYIGLAQRRRRVFVVASAGDVDPSKILFEFDGVRRDTPPSREAWKGFAGVAGTLAASGGGMSRPAGNCNETDFCISVTNGSHWDNPANAHPTLNQSHNTGGIGANNQEIFSQRGSGIVAVPQKWPADIAPTLNAHFGAKMGLEDQHINQGAPLFVPVGFSCKDYGNDAQNDLSPCLRSMNHSGSHQNGGGQVAVAFQNDYCLMDQGGSVMNVEHGITGTLRRETHGHEPSVICPTKMQVRRLTTTECERLQGFPDGYTAIPWRKKSAEECPDGPRYKALGNSMATNVMAWIGNRIKKHMEAM